MKPVVDRLEQRYEGQMSLYLYREADKDAAAGEFASKQKVEVVPTTVLVSAEGKELKRWVGAYTDTEIGDGIEAALASTQ